MNQRPLAPRSQKLYSRLLTRAFGGAEPPFSAATSDLAGWPESQKDLLRAAVKRAYGEDTGSASAILRSIPKGYQIERVVKIPTEEEALKYETATRKLPRGRRVMALLPLALGLRAEELISLPRAAIDHAAKTGDLVFVRKGGREQLLRVAKSKKLLDGLLSVPAAERGTGGGLPAEWRVAGEVLSIKGYDSQYQALRRLVRKVCRAAGITEFSPHKLRHAFATRLNRDGATLATIGAALNHKSLTTTAIYVHPSSADVEEHMRPFEL
jgi:site-specific recombinase XerD